MLLIESVKVREVQGDRVEVFTQRPSIGAFDPTAKIEPTIKIELVRGSRFYDRQGNESCIGMTKEVQEHLKLPFDVYYDMSNALIHMDGKLRVERSVSYRLRYRLQTLKEMSFWERLSRVFVGFSTLSLK